MERTHGKENKFDEYTDLFVEALPGITATQNVSELGQKDESAHIEAWNRRFIPNTTAMRLAISLTAYGITKRKR